MNGALPASRPLDGEYVDFVAQAPGARVWHGASLLRWFGRGARGASWEYVGLRDDAGALTAALPYYRKRRLDGWAIVMAPPLRYLGPCLGAPWMSRPREASAYLLSVLPKGYRSFDQTWAPNALEDDGAAFSAGTDFRRASRPTYVLDYDDALGELERRPNKSMRKRLRRASTYWTCGREALTPAAHDVLEASVRRRDVPVAYSREALSAAVASLGDRAVAHVARHPDGRIGAVSVALADEQTAYCWLSGSTREARERDGGSFVLWEDVRWGRARGCRRVDFLGSALPGPAENRRQLGGVLTHYHHVYRDTAPWTRLLRRWRGGA